jgi:hypothetical protein
MQFVKEEWPSEDVIETIVEKSGGYFIYPSTVVRFVGDEGDCIERLQLVMGIKYDSGAQPFGELDKLYSEILSSCPPGQLALLKRILGFFVFPVAIPELTTIQDVELWLNLRPGQARQLLRCLRALINLGSEGELIVIHTSLTDFLLDPGRSQGFCLDLGQWCGMVFHCAFTFACKALNLTANTEQTITRYLTFLYQWSVADHEH